jgi:DNA replication and repair protein RecF
LGRLIVRSVTLRDFRSYPALDLELQPGIVLAVGPNGAGKTNLLEALHVGTQGFSPRTRTDAQLVRFGADAARVELRGVRADSPVEVEVTLRPGEAKRAQLNGAPLRAAEQLRSSLATLVFTPDRLVVVKGGPSARRAYFDRSAGRLYPARAVLPAEYAAAVAQRNAALRRTSLGFSSRAALEPWTERVAALGAQLVEARLELTRELGPLFTGQGEALGLQQAELGYDGEPPEIQALEARLDEDLERGTTGLGPHLHDFMIAVAGRELRRFGSQGEQRLAVLSLILAEAELLAARGPAPPLLLLDDVLSELDERRRRTLAERIEAGTQAFITSTSAAALPAVPAQLVEVAPGTARTAA